MICVNCAHDTDEMCLGISKHPTYCDSQHHVSLSRPVVKRDLAAEFNLYPEGRPVKVRLTTADPGPDKVSIFDKPWKELV